MKETIINDELIYAKKKVEGSRTDFYFNRKTDHHNSERGHAAFIDGKKIFNRPGPALAVENINGENYLTISGSPAIRVSP